MGIKITAISEPVMLTGLFEDVFGSLEKGDTELTKYR